MADRDPERMLAGMLAEAQALSRIGPSAQRSTAVEEVTDPTGAVSLRIEPGGRVTAVAVAADWRDRLRPDALGAAVRDLAVRWQLRPLQALTDAAADPGPVFGVRPPVVPPAREPSWDELVGMLGTVQRALSLLPELTGTARRDAAQVVGHSANRLVTVTLAVGQVADVTVDEVWAERANRQPLSDALAEAFTDAYERTLAGDTGGGGDGGAGTDRLAGVTRDLQAIVQRLGVVLPPAGGGTP